ncbi:hypothetical protein QTI51_38915, partial [Variovorax sp. J22G73]|nr:hypothetical protein [Variovorax sp. J22G73]
MPIHDAEVEPENLSRYTSTLRDRKIMEFGVFILAQQRGYHQTSQQVINNSIEQTVVAEQAGFNNAW